MARQYKRFDRGALLRYISSYTEEHGHAPSIREMAMEFGDRSSSVIRFALSKLERDGKIRLKPGVHRSIVVIGKDGDESTA